MARSEEKDRILKEWEKEVNKPENLAATRKGDEDMKTWLKRYDSDSREKDK